MRSSESLIRKIIRNTHLMDPIAAITKIGAGPFNIVYRVNFGDARPDAVLRIRKQQTSAYGHEFAAERLVYPLLDGRHVYVPPLLYVSLDGSPFGFPFAVFDFIEGRRLDQVLSDPSVTLHDRMILLEKLAHSLSQLHQVVGPGFGRLKAISHCECQWREYFEPILRESESGLEAYAPELADPYRDAMHEWLRRMEEWPDESRKPVLVHGDLHARNIIVGEGEILFLIDWEASGFQSGASDLAQFRYFNLRHDRKTANHWIRCYMEAGRNMLSFEEIAEQMDMWQCVWQCRMGILQVQFPQHQDEYFGWASDHFRAVQQFLSKRGFESKRLRNWSGPLWPI